MFNKHFIKTTARITLCTMLVQLVFPLVSNALTSGPTQPEVRSFEPVGTTDMVDLFTGDFVYNIPLLDVEGYPVNISYHSGGDMDQEASWVGYGWNINPGVINRSVRGLPDDFNGENVSKTLNIKDERNIKVGSDISAEILGVGDPHIALNASLGGCLNFSNYRGVSADINLSLQASVNIIPKASAGVTFGAGSQSGADVNYNLGLSFNTSQIVGADVAGGFGITFGHGYNTRSGVKDQSLSISTNASVGGKNFNGPSFSKVVPIGIKNVVPVVTNSSSMKSFRGQIKVGGELWGIYPHFGIFGQVSKLKYDSDGSKKGYGYFYSQNATVNDMQDFTRDRDGMFNETMDFLPLGNMTYDVYSVAGQGTGGSFRPFRNDYGTVYDPVLSSKSSNFELNIEAGWGGYFEIGGDGTHSKTDITSGPWDEYQRPFTNKSIGSIYENVYFKQAGELTMIDTAFYATIGKFGAVKGTATKNIPLKKVNSEKKRDPRANLISYHTGADALKQGIVSTQSIYNYNWGNGFPNGAAHTPQQISRVSDKRKEHFITEVVQTQTDGRRYVFGIAAMNNTQNEYSFAVEGNPSGGLIGFTNGQDNSANNKKGRDNYYSNTSTPAYAHSYLLTSVLSTDYVDVTGNGPSDDDLGSFTKFNYARKTDSYRWRAPYQTDMAQYNEGFKSDKTDDKGSYLEGTREQWMLHSIETKNYIAEFHISEREDAKGAGSGVSYKLDEIRLYSKHERFQNPATAVPIKTVIFDYDYSLCKNIPNGTPGKGKLTLKKIFIKYGNSDKSMISPYQFDYDEKFNYPFVYGNKDRWGVYKPGGGQSNVDFPFVDQRDTSNNAYASAWSLTKIKLPSGGNIDITYEADDYGYVQNKEAMEMFKLKGVGNSKEYSSGNRLYNSKDAPNNYFYFERDTAREDRSIPFKHRYLKNDDIMYYNMNTSLTEKGANYEPIKGYGQVVEIDTCPGSSTYAYVKLKPVTPKGGGASINPATYTAINFGRFHLPHIIFPGSNPDNPGILNILAGLKYAIKELMQFSKNPIKRMVQEGKAQEVVLNSSFIRLNSPGLKKKGGGQRVKELAFSDKWSKLSGSDNNDASYGKRYKYTLDIGNEKEISSGVASYEPQIGGDENPFRMPADYIAQSGSNWPPNDPVGLYQELPIGESLYPSPVVGYSRVVVESIHKDKAKSAQGFDIHEFYTAKDFPIRVENTAKDVLDKEETYEFDYQNVIYRATQGYVLRFNDMHGKPKRNEHRIAKPGSGVSELVSYTQYNYNSHGNHLNNEVPVMEYDPLIQKMKKTTRTLGVESDLTIDTRAKKEKTNTETLYANLNTIAAGPIPIPIPWVYTWPGEFNNEFSAVVATKVIQQYGILMEVETFQEGAVTKMRNEAFDPVTGQALITSVNNEYNDIEYSVNYPGHWGYKSMGPSYMNLGYEDEFTSLQVANHRATIPNTSGRFMMGDELQVTYIDSTGTSKTTNAWVMEAAETAPGNMSGIIRCHGDCPEFAGMPIVPHPDTVFLPNSNEIGFHYCKGDDPHPTNSCRFNYVIMPRYKKDFPQSGSITQVKVRVVRSGARNMLTESIQNYTAMETPFEPDNTLRDQLNKVININAKEFSTRLQAFLPRYDAAVNPTQWDSLNPYVSGRISIPRLFKELAYMKNRNYNNPTNRDKGLFDAMSYWSFDGRPSECVPIVKYCLSRYSDSAHGAPVGGPLDVVYQYYDYINPDVASDYGLFAQLGNQPNWITVREVTKWSPWGFELENKDAVGNYTAAQYGYNEQLPVALAQNARQHQILFEGFEDYKMLQPQNALLESFIAPFKNVFPKDAMAGTLYSLFRINPTTGSKLNAANSHSGQYALETNSTGHTLNFNIINENTTSVNGKYMPFTFGVNKSYIISYWYRPINISSTMTTYNYPGGYLPKSNIIEGWQLFETKVTPTATGTYALKLPPSAYIDDLRIFPADANMKSFVYNPTNQRLMATLDENNFASFFEYDQEGNLVRTKKETEKGIMTISESRSANPKTY